MTTTQISTTPVDVNLIPANLVLDIASLTTSESYVSLDSMTADDINALVVQYGDKNNPDYQYFKKSWESCNGEDERTFTLNVNEPREAFTLRIKCQKSFEYIFYGMNVKPYNDGTSFDEDKNRSCAHFFVNHLTKSRFILREHTNVQTLDVSKIEPSSIDGVDITVNGHVPSQNLCYYLYKESMESGAYRVLDKTTGEIKTLLLAYANEPGAEPESSVEQDLAESEQEITPDVPPAPSTALEFNGTSDYIAVDHALPIATQVTVEMWLQGAPPQESFLFYFTNDGNERIVSAHLPWSNGYFAVDSGDNNGYARIIKALDPVNAGSWNHWAFTRDSTSGQMTLYKNGAVYCDGPPTLNRPMPAITRLVIAAKLGPILHHAGTFSEFRVWNVVRTEAQINEGMTRRLDSVQDNLLVSYAMDGGTNGQLLDRSGNNRHGVIHGAPRVLSGPPALS